jgi:antitoxin component of MazEF toxin-antitoxin module
MEAIRKIVSADTLIPFIDLPWASKGLQVEVTVIPHLKQRKYNSLRQQWKNRKHLTTKERIAAFGDTIEDISISEIDWGKPQGKEIW